MINGLSIGDTRMKLLAGALLFGFASLASAQSSILVGGGATLPAAGYAGDTTTRLQGPLRADTTGDGTLLGEYAKTQTSPFSVSYCQTGSGGGKNVLAGNSPSTFTVNAACDGTSPIGFGATSLGETLAQPHFVGSDSPIAASDLTNYSAGHASGQPVQIPAVSGAIAIVFNKTDTLGNPLPSLNLTEQQVCRVFSGNIKTWNDANLASAIPSGVTVSGPIKIVYRSDGSGTSFAFSNHLSKICGATAAPPVGTGGNGLATLFKTDQAFATAASSYFASYSSSLGASGNPGVIAAIQDPTNDGAIGYAETANALNGFVSFASVSNKAAPSTFIDPSTYGGTTLPVSVTYDQVISGVNSLGRPTLAASGLSTQCIGIVNPEDYASPASGYPIVAVSYLLANSAANGLDVAHVRGVLFAPYNSTVKAQVNTIGASTGLSFLSINGATSAQIQTKINGCVN
jgi:ABC-type phosphate transport system substrate-binding protein